MTSYELLSLVEKAKMGDKEAMIRMIQMFDPLIKKICRRSHPNERNDLRQHLTEKIIGAILNYDLSTVPEYSVIIRQLLSKK